MDKDVEETEQAGKIRGVEYRRGKGDKGGAEGETVPWERLGNIWSSPEQ